MWSDGDAFESKHFLTLTLPSRKTAEKAMLAVIKSGFKKWQGQLMEAKKALTAAVHVLARLSRLCIETGGGILSTRCMLSGGVRALLVVLYCMRVVLVFQTLEFVITAATGWRTRQDLSRVAGACMGH